MADGSPGRPRKYATVDEVEELRKALAESATTATVGAASATGSVVPDLHTLCALTAMLGIIVRGGKPRDLRTLESEAAYIYNIMQNVLSGSDEAPLRDQISSLTAKVNKAAATEQELRRNLMTITEDRDTLRQRLEGAGLLPDVVAV